MTARHGRAVRVEPGATSDRRVSAGDGSSAALRPREPKCIDGVRTSARPSESVAVRRVGLTEQHAGTPSSDTVSVREAQGFDELGSGKRTKPLKELRPRHLPGDSYSSLYELERHRGTFEILLLLYSVPSATRYLMRQRVWSGQLAFEGALRNLIRLGLVRCEPASSFPFTRSYWLTERGNKLVVTPMSLWPPDLLT
jgi:DNA-binding HxlR family transcriptional regulator